MRKLAIMVLTSLALLSSGAWAEGMSKEQMAAVKHANPMPNLMKVVGENQDKLKLNDEQKKALSQWVDRYKPRMMKMVKAVNMLEKQLHDAALAGAPGAVLKKIASQMLSVRGAIVKQKVMCRNNLARILTRDQLKQTLQLYKKQNG